MNKINSVVIAHGALYNSSHHRNSARLFFITSKAMIPFVFSVGWKESQNTYLFASEHVNGFILSHM